MGTFYFNFFFFFSLFLSCSLVQCTHTGQSHNTYRTLYKITTTYIKEKHHTTTTTHCKLQKRAHLYVCTLVNAWLAQEKHHQCKSQIMPTVCASEVFVQIDGRKNTTSASFGGPRPSWALVGAECSNQMQVAQGQGLVPWDHGTRETVWRSPWVRQLAFRLPPYDTPRVVPVIIPSFTSIACPLQEEFASR